MISKVQSWGELDWDNPNPNDVRYFYAIVDAITERAMFLHKTPRVNDLASGNNNTIYNNCDFSSIWGLQGLTQKIKDVSRSYCLTFPKIHLNPECSEVYNRYDPGEIMLGDRVLIVPPPLYKSYKNGNWLIGAKKAIESMRYLVFYPTKFSTKNWGNSDEPNSTNDAIVEANDDFLISYNKSYEYSLKQQDTDDTTPFRLFFHSELGMDKEDGNYFANMSYEGNHIFHVIPYFRDCSNIGVRVFADFNRMKNPDKEKHYSKVRKIIYHRNPPNTETTEEELNPFYSKFFHHFFPGVSVGENLNQVFELKNFKFDGRTITLFDDEIRAGIPWDFDSPPTSDSTIKFEICIYCTILIVFDLNPLFKFKSAELTNAGD